MRRGFTYIGAWAVATATAVVFTWLGVRDVIRDAVFERAGSVPVLPPVSAAPPPPPAPMSVAPPTTEKPTSQPPKTSRPPTSSTPKPAGDVHGYEVTGGRVVLSLGPASAHLISATPKPGYEVKDWSADGWLRVDLTTGEHGSAVFATWNGHPPTVETYEY